jgi:hypothetical protein
MKSALCGFSGTFKTFFTYLINRHWARFQQGTSLLLLAVRDKYISEMHPIP